MSIEREHYEGPIIFLCDGKDCSESLHTDEENFHTALNDMRAEGWRNRRDPNGDWGHYCPSCDSTGIKPFAKNMEDSQTPVHKAPVKDLDQGMSSALVAPGTEVTLGDSIIYMSENGITEIAPDEFYDSTPKVVMPEIQLGPQQAEAEKQIMRWLDDSEDPFFVLAGYAGTGKTTLSRKIAANLNNKVTFGAFTGKAVSILREKGCPNVDTIHALLYKPVGHDRTKLSQMKMDLEEAKKQGNMFLADSFRASLNNLVREMRRPKFELNSESMGGDVLFVDEYSMLPNEIVADLKRKYRKILFMGDPFQLPPVKGNCNLQPDFFLTEIHRQALESAIVRLSKDIRENNSFAYGDYGDLLYIPASQAHADMYLNTDQIIVGRNATRNSVNQWIRKMRCYTSPLPMAGEKLICLKNNKKANIFNGMICNALHDAIKTQPHHTSYLLQIDQKLPEGYETLRVWEGDVMGKGDDYDWNDWSMKSLQRFDYAHAITCHKSQGSEFKNCVVFNEPVGADDEMRRRWIYTAITRGKEHVTLIQP